MPRATPPEWKLKGSGAVDFSRGTKVLPRAATGKEMESVEENPSYDSKYVVHPDFLISFKYRIRSRIIRV